MNQVIFLFLSLVAIIGAIAVIFSKNPVYSVLFLVMTFFAIAGHYALILQAGFLAIVNIIVYAGAIMVLFLYVIMLLNLNNDTEPKFPMLPKVLAIFCGGLFLLTLLGALTQQSNFNAITNADATLGSVSNLGKILFTEFLLPFEVTSVLFLATIIGAVMLGKKNLKDN